MTATPAVRAGVVVGLGAVAVVGGVAVGRRGRGAIRRSGAPGPLRSVRRPPTGGGNTQVLGPDREPRPLRALAAWVPEPPRSRAARVLVRTWAAPMSAIGLLVGATTATRPRVRDGVLLFAPAGGLAGAVLRLRGYAAITLGHVVIARVDPGPRLMTHELVHTRQAERLGPLFAPVYLALHAAYGYARHPFERAARLAGRTA